jgi:hypothetical protein
MVLFISRPKTAPIFIYEYCRICATMWHVLPPPSNRDNREYQAIVNPRIYRICATNRSKCSNQFPDTVHAICGTNFRRPSHPEVAFLFYHQLHTNTIFSSRTNSCGTFDLGPPKTHRYCIKIAHQPTWGIIKLLTYIHLENGMLLAG